MVSARDGAAMGREPKDELFRGLAAHIPDALCICDSGGTVRYVNSAWEGLTRRPLAAGDAFGKTLAAIHPHDLPELLQEMGRRPGGGVDHECRVVHPDGAVRWVRGRSFRIGDAASAVGQVAWLVHDITERRDASTTVRQMAHYDALTGLPNRALLHESLGRALEQARVHGWTVSVLSIDVDRFKSVNDTFGHAAGDVLLQQLSSRLLKCLRIRDTVGRLGGDEFALVLVTTGTPDAARRVAEKVGDVLRQPVSVTGGRVAVTVSIGVAVNEAGSVDGPTLIGQADVARHAAKSGGGDGYRVHAPGAENGALSWPMAWRPVARMGNASRRQT